MNAKDIIKQTRESGPVTESSAAPAANITEAWVDNLLGVMKKKFIEERVTGFKHPKTEKYYGPVPLAEAEERWTKVEPRFRDQIKNDPEIRQKFGTNLHS